MQCRCTVHCHLVPYATARCTAITLLDTIIVVKRYVSTMRRAFHERQIQLLLTPIISRVVLQRQSNCFYYLIDHATATAESKHLCQPREVPFGTDAVFFADCTYAGDPIGTGGAKRRPEPIVLSASVHAHSGPNGRRTTRASTTLLNSK